VVGETKTPVKLSVSWLNAARDINTVYEKNTPGFFVPNVLSFATEGKDFRYGPVGLPAEMWLPWGKTDEELMPLGMGRALRSVESLLAPEAVLEMLRSYSLYSTLRIGSAARAIKIIARYQQVEAVEALVERAKDSAKQQGLVWHHQGSGKTFLMAFACGKLRREVPGSTVIVVLDRLDLIEQTTREFESAGVPELDADLGPARGPHYDDLPVQGSGPPHRSQRRRRPRRRGSSHPGGHPRARHAGCAPQRDVHRDDWHADFRRRSRHL
jgi:type I restriction enzyme R subunit